MSERIEASSKAKRAQAALDASSLSGSGEKVLHVLRAFADTKQGMTADEVGQRCGFPRSSTYRYLQTLRKAGFVRSDARDSFYLSPLLMQLAQTAQISSALPEFSQPYLDKLVAASGETAILVERAYDKCVCMARAEPSHALRISFQLGASLPLIHGAAPKLLLAYSEPKEQQKIIAAAMHTDAWVQSHRALLEHDLTEIAARGYSVSAAEITPDVYAIAAPIWASGKLRAALSLVCARHRIADKDEAVLRELVVRAAAKISKDYFGA